MMRALRVQSSECELRSLDHVFIVRRQRLDYQLINLALYTRAVAILPRGQRSAMSKFSREKETSNQV